MFTFALKIAAIVIAVFYLALNILTSKYYTAREMKSRYLTGCLVGKIASAVFYAPAWLFKGIRAVVTKTIA